MRFSIIIPVYLSQSTLRRCIESLKIQSFSDFEVIFVDSSPDERCVEIVREFPEVRLVRSHERLWMHAARNVGAQHARGEIVVFTDPDCVPNPDWLSKLDESFRLGHMVVGGAIGCYPGGQKEMAAHIVKYWTWLPNAPSGSIDDIPTANFAIERALFDSIGGFSERYFSADSLMSYRLRERGFRLYFNAGAVVQHIHEVTVRSLLRERYARGKDFLAMRSSLNSWSRLKSFLLLAGVWVLPWFHFFRKMIVCGRRGFLKPLIIRSPMIFSCDVAWMIGQGVNCWRHLFGLEFNDLMHQST